MVEASPTRRDLRRSHGQRTRAAILHAAVDSASEGGLEALTIGRLAKELEMSKAGVFTHFGSKEGLLIATVDAARDRFAELVVRPAFERESGLARLDALFEGNLGLHASPCFSGGCFFGKASAEFENRPGAVRERIIAVVGEWASLVRATLERAVEQGELSADTDVELLAFEWLALTQRASRSAQLGHTRSIELARRAISQRLAPLLVTAD